MTVCPKFACAALNDVGAVECSECGAALGVFTRSRCNTQGYVWLLQIGTDRIPGERWREKEHRVVARTMIGRDLRADEHVHHVNRDRADNRPENLVVMDAGAHRRLHGFKKNQEPAAATPQARDGLQTKGA